MGIIPILAASANRCVGKEQTMRTTVITDLHANLPALEAVLEAIDREGYDQIVHTGDVVGIGPHPVECLERLASTPNVRLVVGNHDNMLVEGIPNTLPGWVHPENPFERTLWAHVEANAHWTHAQVDPRWQSLIATWPRQIRAEYEGVEVAFQHYAFASAGDGFKPWVHDATAADLDALFEPNGADILFYGHAHPQSDLVGRAQYVNPGSLGCHTHAVARYCVAEFHRGTFVIEHRCVPYDDDELFRAFEHRAVPGRAFFYPMFFGGRLG
jgi:putative phosphoesterase